MSTVTITKGDGFTAISFVKPIAELRKYIYNGDEFFDTVDLSEAETFWDKGQELLIYQGGRILYACNVREMKIKGRWRKILIDAWDDSGPKFDYEAKYKQLVMSM